MASKAIVISASKNGNPLKESAFPALYKLALIAPSALSKEAEALKNKVAALKAEGATITITVEFTMDSNHWADLLSPSKITKSEEGLADF
jgi:hypothetical protein